LLSLSYYFLLPIIIVAINHSINQPLFAHGWPLPTGWTCMQLERT
jgi:hypothetical protein